MEKSSFKAGQANAPTHTKLTAADAGGKGATSTPPTTQPMPSESERWALAENPLREEPLPAKGLRSVGG